MECKILSPIVNLNETSLKQKIIPVGVLLFLQRFVWFVVQVFLQFTDNTSSLYAPDEVSSDGWW